MRCRALFSFALLALFGGQASANELTYDPAAAGTPTEQMLSQCDSCQTCDACEACCKGPLLGFIQPTDTGWSNFISPMTNPVFFEDPRTLSEVRFIFAHHNIPSLAGGAIPASDIQVFAAQFRIALTEDLSIIATKDGYIIGGGDAPLVDGWADVALGLKYNLYKDCCYTQILSAGLVYELPVGSQQALQGNGDGEFNLFLSGGLEFDCNSHFLSTVGVRLPANTAAENQVFYWSFHLDRRIDTCRNIYAFVEANWMHWLSDGANPALPGVTSGDFFNLGNAGVAGRDFVSAAFGLKCARTTCRKSVWPGNCPSPAKKA